MLSDKSAPVPDSAKWDALVKFVHWAILLLVAVNALVVEEGAGWHIWAGYALDALLALRLVWGFVGPAEARFSAFSAKPDACHPPYWRNPPRRAHRATVIVQALAAAFFLGDAVLDIVGNARFAAQP